MAVFLKPRIPRSLMPYLTLLLGAVSVLGFAPFYLFPLPVLALAILLRLADASAPRGAFLSGYLFGLGWYLAGVSWVYVSMHDVGGMPAPVAGLAVLLFAGYLALFPGLALYLATRWRLTPALRWLLVLPALWALLDWVRGWFLTGFPWQALGYSQAPYSPLAGYAPILGVYGVTWLAALTAGALALGRRYALVLAAFVWLAGWGLQQLSWTRPEGAPVTVSLLQGNIPQHMKFRPEELAQTLQIYRRLVLGSTGRLIVLPETAIPLWLDSVPAAYLAQLADHAARNGGDVLLGVPLRENGDRYYNALVSMGRAPGQIFLKVHLVPFGEFIPPGFKWFLDLMNIPLGDFDRGAPDQPPMQVAGQRVAASICYEDVFGEELIHALPAATLMVNVSDDAWFGRSFAPWQHLQIGQMRALETGRWWLRATNTGITAMLDAKGRVVKRLPPFTTGVLQGQAQGMRGMTPYDRWGNYGFLAFTGLALAVAWAMERKARRGPGSVS